VTGAGGMLPTTAEEQGKLVITGEFGDGGYIAAERHALILRGRELPPPPRRARWGRDQPRGPRRGLDRSAVGGGPGGLPHGSPQGSSVLSCAV
jgi:hypothetical protein